MLDALLWYVALQAAALAIWPFARCALQSLPDRGWAVTKTLGPLAMAWLVWLVCMLSPAPFTRLGLVLALAVIAGVGWLWPGRDMAHRARQHPRTWPVDWRTVGTLEAVFVVALVGFALLRSLSPAIAGTEKPMDMAFLNGFIAADHLPTDDTWLAGYATPYYYFGYFVFACLAKLSGVPGGVAFNLAAATVPALAIVSVAALLWGLARLVGLSRRWSVGAGALAVTLTMLAGNFAPALELLVSRGVLNTSMGPALGIKSFATGPGSATVSPGVWPPGDGWWFRASRVVPNIQPDGITEFPFFSAYLADLHPHFMALPFELLVVTLAAAHLVSKGATLRSWWTQGASALALGALLVINTWDIAPFWLLYLGVAWLAGGYLPLGERLLRTLAGPVVGVLLVSPYFVGYGGPPLGIGLVTERTPLSSLLVLFGAQIALLVALGLWARWRVNDRRGWIVAGAGAGAGVLLVLMREPTLGVLVALLALLLPWPIADECLTVSERLALYLGTLATAMLLGVELIFLRDTFGTRMNTVFKFDYNAWLLSGLAAALGAVLVISSAPRAARWAAGALTTILVLGGLVYPVSAGMTRVAERAPGSPTLDGLGFIASDDRAAIRFLRDQIGPERPVVAEALGGQYSYGARMATYSGATTVLGWAGHELQWRGPLPELGHREADLTELYKGTDPDSIRRIADQYGLRFIVVGDFERQQYGPEVDQRFANVLPVAFRAGRTTVYRASAR